MGSVLRIIKTKPIFNFVFDVYFSSPKISLEDTKGLSDIQKNELIKEMNDLCDQKKGEVVIYDLAHIVQSFLHKHNKPPSGSFYDQMLIERKNHHEALMQQQAQRLSHEQRLLRDEVLKRKEILQNEDRWRRDTRRSMSEQSPTHRTNSSTDIADLSPVQRNRIYPNGCDLHLSSRDLDFTSIGRNIRRGCCLGRKSFHSGYHLDIKG